MINITDPVKILLKGFNSDKALEKEIVKDRLYYIFYKCHEYITVSGVGDDPHNLTDIRWNSSKGAKGIVKQIMEIKSGYTADMGFIKISDHPNNIYAQICLFETIYKDGWRHLRNNLVVR